MPDALQTFARNVRKVRTERGFTQEALAHAADLNMTHVARIERAEREPGVRVIGKLCVALECSAADLFRGIDRPE